MGAKSSKNESSRRHLRLSLLRRFLQGEEAKEGRYVTHGICYWPGKPVRFKDRRKLIQLIEKESTAPATPTRRPEDAQWHLPDIPPSLEPPEFPFENLVLSGGGIRGYSYIGAIQALEDVGALKYIKRYAGASAGAMAATVLAIGFNAQDIAKCFYLDLKETFTDQDCKCVTILPKLLTQYGLHPAKRYYDCLGKCIERKTGNPDLTFKQYNEMYGKEICIVVCNVTKMTAVYCHHTTTPLLPLRVAVRMSMAVPFMFEPVKVDVSMSGDKSNVNVYVDGSLADHFPIRCFDGDTVGRNPDGPINPKTIGCYLVSEKDSDYLLWDTIFGKTIPFPSYLPDTKLARTSLKEEMKRRRKMQADFSSKEFLSGLATSCENMLHYETPSKPFVPTDNLLDVIITNLESILHQQVMTRLKAEDEMRTIPINTGYIKSHEYDIEPADREFMINQGYECTVSFLEKYRNTFETWKRRLRKESNV